MAISSISATPALQDVARTNGESVLRSNVQTPAAVQSSQATSQTTETVSAPAAPATSEQILQALSDVQTALQPVARNLQFSLDDDTGRTVIKVIDTTTDEVIKQFPSEEILAISKALDQLQGLLIKQEA